MGLNNLNVKDLFDFLIRNYLGRYVTASPRFPASSLRQNSNSYYTRNPMTLRPVASIHTLKPLRFRAVV